MRVASVPWGVEAVFTLLRMDADYTLGVVNNDGSQTLLYASTTDPERLARCRDVIQQWMGGTAAVQQTVR